MLSPHEPLLVTPNVESLLINYLYDELSSYSFPYTEGIDVSISTASAADRPTSPSNLVTVLAVDGGGVDRFTSEIPVVITCYSTSKSNALRLAQLVESLIIHRVPLLIADIYFTAALGSAVVDDEDNSDRVFSRFQNFIMRAKKQPL